MTFIFFTGVETTNQTSRSYVNVYQRVNPLRFFTSFRSTGVTLDGSYCPTVHGQIQQLSRGATFEPMETDVELSLGRKDGKGESMGRELGVQSFCPIRRWLRQPFWLRKDGFLGRNVIELMFLEIKLKPSHYCINGSKPSLFGSRPIVSPKLKFDLKQTWQQSFLRCWDGTKSIKLPSYHKISHH